MTKTGREPASDKPDWYQCEPCPVCGQKTFATGYVPHAVCETCIDRGNGPTVLRVAEVYLPRKRNTA